MALPYDTQTITGYNDNPPPDDGSQSEENRVKYETTKNKLADPLHTTIESINTELLAAFAKMIGGGSVVTTAINATVGASDQGKGYLATGSGGITITTPDAAGTGIGSPFWFVLLNTASSAITLDGNGSQTVNGAASISVPPGGGYIVFTDGTNWFAAGASPTLSGSQLGPGMVVNGTITESNGSNAATFAVKTLAGNDPSASDPVVIAFRNATAATGNYVYRTITAALSLVISSGSTLGAVSGTAFDVWLVLFDDAGTIRLGAIQPVLTGTAHYDLGQIPPIASSTAEGGAGGADTAKTFYTGTAVTSKAYAILGVAKYASGLVTAGTWNASPSTIQLFGPNITPPAVPDSSLATPGAWKLLQTVAASSSATVDLETTLDGTYDRYMITIDGAVPQTDDQPLNLRLKIGGAYASAGSDYYWNNQITVGAAVAAAGDVADSEITLTAVAGANGVGSTAGESISLELYLRTPAATGLFPHIWWSGSYDRAAGDLAFLVGNGRYQAAAAITGVRFFFSSGNITSGSFKLYGLKRSLP